MYTLVLISPFIILSLLLILFSALYLQVKSVNSFAPLNERAPSEGAFAHTHMYTPPTNKKYTQRSTQNTRMLRHAYCLVVIVFHRSVHKCSTSMCAALLIQVHICRLSSTTLSGYNFVSARAGNCRSDSPAI